MAMLNKHLVEKMLQVVSLNHLKSQIRHHLILQGQCTWYVYERVQQFGKKVGSDWGDAHNWDNRAESDNYDVSQTPSTHSAVVFEAGQAGAHDIYGHVAFVER